MNEQERDEQPREARSPDDAATAARGEAEASEPVSPERDGHPRRARASEPGAPGSTRTRREAPRERATSTSEASTQVAEPVAPAVPPVVTHAEQLVDAALLWAASLGTVVSRRLSKTLARTKEELEDVLAEAEALRQAWQRGQQSADRSRRSTDP
ncbi:hypothetical protein [Thermomicrobium sp.]